MALVMDIARRKIIMSRAIKSTGTLIVIHGPGCFCGGETIQGGSGQGAISDKVLREGVVERESRREESTCGTLHCLRNVGSCQYLLLHVYHV
jgi:hypothetical protein